MNIIKTVVVKQVITEKSKRELLIKFENELAQLHKENEQLRFEQKRMEKSGKYNPNAIKVQFDNEYEKRKDKIKNISFQMEQLQILPLGSEVKEGEVQALYEVNIGDSWDSKSKNSEIIVQEGIIKEIR